MKSLCLYFQVHQPFRLRTYRFFDIGADHYYYDDYLNRHIVKRIALNCYIPANQVLLDLIKQYGAAMKVSFSISGTAIEQFQKYAPEVLDSFAKLAATGNVEFLGETYSHSLASIYNPLEFKRQVEEHAEMITKLFGKKPTTFRNTELIFSNEIASQVFDMGFNTILTEGAKQVLGWKSPNFLYCSSVQARLKVLMRNYQMSDDIAFRFSQRDWNEWPLTADKFMTWLNMVEKKQEIINLFMDYETFGEHQKADTGIFEFLKAFPAKLIKSGKWKLLTPAEAAEQLQPVAAINVPHAISWADEERDLTAWIGNDLQNEALENLYAVQHLISQLEDASILSDWHYLQASDHFYYMCTKWFSDGAVHHYFNPYSSPYEAFLNYMNVLSDFLVRVKEMAATRGIQVDTVNAVSKIPVKKTAKVKAVVSSTGTIKKGSPAASRKKKPVKAKPVKKKL